MKLTKSKALLAAVYGFVFMAATPAVMAAPVAIDAQPVVDQLQVAGAGIVLVGMAYLGMKAIAATIRLIRGAMS